MHIAGKGIWHNTKTFAMEQEILMEFLIAEKNQWRSFDAYR